MLYGCTPRPYLRLSKGQMFAEMWPELSYKGQDVHIESARPFMVQGGASGQREGRKLARATSPLVAAFEKSPF